MIQINLLPWREEAKKTKMLRFALFLGLSLGFTLILIMSIHVYYGSLLAGQEARNQFLQTELGKKQEDFNALNQQKKDMAKLAKELAFVTNLRQQSLNVVSLMEALNELTPNDVIVLRVAREGKVVTIEGQAKSDVEVTDFIKALSHQPGFQEVVLTEMNAEKVSHTEGKSFEIKVEQQDMNG